jgi:hypothetical protein
MLAAIAGCDSTSPPPLAATSETAQLRVGFPARGLADTIAIDAVERLPLRSAELVAPDGTVTRSGPIDVEDRPRVATGQWAIAQTWSDPVTGNNALASLGHTNPQANAALFGQEQLLAVVSHAEIGLPDPVAYRRDWQHYRIRLAFGTPPALQTRELAAPAPPPQ